MFSSDLPRLPIVSLGTYRPSQEVLRLVAEIDEFKGAWRALRNIAPERLSALRRVATIESVGSSTRIEGVTLTNAQIELLLSGLETRSFTSRDEEEVAGYAALMETIFSSWQYLPLTENQIKQLHGILLKYSSKDERHRGYYKTLSNNVEAFGPEGESLGIVFETASPFDTPFQMAALVSETRESLEAGLVHPLLLIAAFVVRFLAIHPFQDGNGRLSRALTTLLLLRSGYSYVPYASLESIVEENKESYYLALRRTQGTLKSTQGTLSSDVPDWEPWVTFFARTLHTQKSRLERKIEREQLLEGDLPELSIRILELARERGRVKSSEILILTGEKPGTVRNRLNELVERGLLNRHGKGPATWYTLGIS
ncbi:Fic family protein [Armatimonas sp.]|uniref:Fic family protein n=1 Tax=Armatimonas sp. TaxID=1872638 RepID=UPI0037519FC0